MFQTCQLFRCDTFCPHQSSSSKSIKAPKDTIFDSTHINEATNTTTATTAIGEITIPTQNTVIEVAKSEINETVVQINTIETTQLTSVANLNSIDSHKALDSIPEQISTIEFASETTPSSIVSHTTLDSIPEQANIFELAPEANSSLIVSHKALPPIPEQTITFDDIDKDLIDILLDYKLSYSQIAKKLRRDENVIKRYIELRAANPHHKDPNVFFLNQSGHNIEIKIGDENAASKLENCKSQEIADGQGVILSANDQINLTLYISQFGKHYLDFGKGYRYDGNALESYLDDADLSLIQLCLEYNQAISYISEKVRRPENQIQPYIVTYIESQKKRKKACAPASSKNPLLN